MDVFIVPSLQRGNAAFDAQASCPLYRDRQASALTLWSMGAIPKGTAPITPPLKMVFFIPPFEKKRGGWGDLKPVNSRSNASFAAIKSSLSPFGKGEIKIRVPRFVL